MKYISYTLKTSVIIFFMAMISSCEKSYFVPVNMAPKNVSFSNDIQPIFDASCNISGCHSQGGIPPNLTPAVAYDQLFEFDLVDTISPASSELYEHMTNPQDPMPPSGILTGGQSDYVLAWIQEGAKNN